MFRHSDVFRRDVDADVAPVERLGHARSRPAADEWIEHHVVFVRAGAHDALDQSFRLLCGMILALRVAVVDVRECPHVAGIRAAHVVALAVVLLRDAHCVEVEGVVGALGEVEDVLVTRGKPNRPARALGVVPGNPAVEEQAHFFQNAIQPGDEPHAHEHVEAAIAAQDADALRQPRAREPLVLVPRLHVHHRAVLLAQVVRRIGTHEMHALRRNLWQHGKRVADDEPVGE